MECLCFVIEARVSSPGSVLLTGVAGRVRGGVGPRWGRGGAAVGPRWGRGGAAVGPRWGRGGAAVGCGIALTGAISQVLTRTPSRGATCAGVPDRTPR